MTRNVRNRLVVAVVVLAAAGVADAGTRPPVADRAVLGVITSLQAAVRGGDVAAFDRLVSDPVKLTWTIGGRTQPTTGPRKGLRTLFFSDEKRVVNPFKAPGDLAANVVSARKTPAGDWLVRVKCRWYLQITDMTPAGPKHRVTREMVWHVVDLEIGKVGARLALKGVWIQPKDFYDAVATKWEAFTRETRPAPTDAAKIAKYNELMAAFLGIPDDTKADEVRELPSPPGQLLRNAQVTVAIRGYRRRVDQVVAVRYPRMKNKLLRELVRTFRKQEFYLRIYRRQFEMRIRGRGFRVSISLVFSFGPRGRMYTTIAPTMKLKDPSQKVRSSPTQEKRVAIPEPKVAAGACMVLTNLKKVRERHPGNYEAIRRFLAGYGPVIDIAAAGVSPTDWRAIDSLLERRFDSRKYGCLFIFGGPEVVPHGEYPNPVFGTRDDETDRIIYSDDVYADFNHDAANDWDVVVVRLPDDRGILQDTKSILYQPVPAGDRLKYANFVCYGNCNWPISHDLARMGNPSSPQLRLSEPHTYLNFPASFMKGNNVFLNLHGNDADGTVFAGEKKNTPKKVCIPAFGIQQASAPGALIVATACYGASIRGKTSETSIALRFLRNGARGFVGSTRSTYIGATTERTIGLWGKLITNHLRIGESPQRAFMLAKRDFAKSNIAEPHNYKMFREYVYLGLPPTRYKRVSPPPAGEPLQVLFFRFFEGPDPTPEFLRERLREAALAVKGTARLPQPTRFAKSTTRRVFCQLILKNLDKSKTHRHALAVRYYRADGRLIDELKRPLVIKAESNVLSHVASCGRSTPGTWATGAYRVVAMVDGKKIAEKQFTIWEGTTPRETAQTRTIRYRDGSRYTGPLLNGKWHGLATVVWKNGVAYVGRFEGERAAGGFLVWPSGKVTWSRHNARGQWVNAPAKPGKTISFNNRRWNDLTPAFSAYSPTHFFTDNKYRGTAEVTLWAAYSHPQDFLLRAYPGTTLHDGGKDNQGKRATLKTELVGDPKRAKASPLPGRLARDGVPRDLARTLTGPYVYRIRIDAPDRGYYASYVLLASTPAQRVIGKAKLDDLGKEAGRARVAPFAPAAK